MLVSHAGGDSEALNGGEVVALRRRKVQSVLLLEVEDSKQSRCGCGGGDVGHELHHFTAGDGKGCLVDRRDAPLFYILCVPRLSAWQ